MSSFVADLPATQVHAQLQSALEAYQEAEQNAVLWFADLATRKLYRELRYSSMQQYAVEALGFSEARFYQFQRLAERLTVLPELKQSLADGSIPWTNAREVARVATPETEKAWVEVAKTTSRRELRKQIETVRERRKATRRDVATFGQESFDAVTASLPEVPDANLEVMAGVSLSFTPEQLATFEALLEKAMKLGESGKREDLLLALMTLGAGALTARGRPSLQTKHEETLELTRVQSKIIVQACPDCGRGSVNTNRGPMPLSLQELEWLSCDAVIERDGKNRATVPPRLRRQVLARDGYRCQAAGCGRSLFLNVHHLVHREAGGPNTLTNLTVLCSPCHRTLHEIAEGRKNASERSARDTPIMPRIGRNHAEERKTAT